MDFDVDNDASMMGVTISMAANTDAFSNNLFCEPEVGTECHDGQADCRMSASVFNHKVIVSSRDTMSPTMDRDVGYVFNQTLVETYFGKCSWLFDGATAFRVNNGCGTGASGETKCSNPDAAFYDKCYLNPPSHDCKRDDPDIVNYLCKCEPPICDVPYGTATPPERKQGQAQCFYEMPAMYLDPNDASEADITATNHLRDSLKQRVHNQKDYGDVMQEWNEVVIDNRLLIPQIRRDPTHTILAFVYTSTREGAQQVAEQMRDQFMEHYHVNGVAKIPVIGMDLTVNFTEAGGPFVLPAPSKLDVVDDSNGEDFVDDSKGDDFSATV